MGCKSKKLTNNEIRELVNERKSTGAKYSYLAQKYGVSTDMVFLYCKYDKEGTLEEHLYKREHRKPSELTGLPKIRKYEEAYNPFVTKPQINGFYSETLKIGDNITLTPSAAKRDINAFMYFITGDNFKKKYGRDFTIVDLYLTTNLSIKGLCSTYQGYMSVLECRRAIQFLHKELMKVDNLNLFYTYALSDLNTYYRFTRPSQKRIIEIINQQFFASNKVDATKEQIQKAYEILL